MNKLNIALFGYDSYTGQLPRYREGFEMLGHKLTFENPDIIYANDPTGYKSAIELKNTFSKSCLILHFLDIPWHHKNVNHWINSVTNALNFADVVCVNSEKVKNDLKKYFSKKDLHVTYDISKDVYLDDKIHKKNDFLYVGRANDPVKRINLVKESLKLIPGKVEKIKICGTENPEFGNYIGLISDELLNKLYNETYFVMLPSKNEGIGLSMIEGMICGSVPIMCSDNLTAKEFAPLEFICDPNPESIKNKIEEIKNDYKNYRELALKYGKKYQIQFNKKTIVNNILEIYKNTKID